MCDLAQADSVTECGSTWPKMAFVSHPRLFTTARPLSRFSQLLSRLFFYIRDTSCKRLEKERAAFAHQNSKTVLGSSSYRCSPTE